MTNEAFIYPEHDLPLSQKDKNWHLQWCKAMFGNFTGYNNTHWFYNARSYYQYLRQYATGTQDIQKYKDKVDCTDADNKSTTITGGKAPSQKIGMALFVISFILAVIKGYIK